MTARVGMQSVMALSDMRSIRPCDSTPPAPPCTPMGRQSSLFCQYHAHAMAWLHMAHPCAGSYGSGRCLPACCSLIALSRAFSALRATAAASLAASTRCDGRGATVVLTVGPQGRQRTASGLGCAGLSAPLFLCHRLSLSATGSAGSMRRALSRRSRLGSSHSVSSSPNSMNLYAQPRALSAWWASAGPSAMRMSPGLPCIQLL
mmetsp:Transcript_31019/g.79124  ORF Transcript_31019/g.79124 Transcript_31019/m.79124 type:complete len:204 (-) Transcript_31019:275-886(-)